MTKPKRYKRFSSEFKREAILRANEEGMTDKAVCDELGVSTRQFRRWRDELALLGKGAFLAHPAFSAAPNASNSPIVHLLKTQPH